MQKLDFPIGPATYVPTWYMILSWGQERNTENVIMIFLLLLETKTDVVVDDYEWEAPLWPLNCDQSIIILWRPINQVYAWLMHKANVTFILYAKIFTLE